MAKKTEIVSNKTIVFMLKELFEYRELFFHLAWRDILVRYKQTVLGVGWVLIRPLLTMLIFTFIFGRVAGFSSNGIPYTVLGLSGILVWQFFSDSFLYGSNSFLANVVLVTKVYFPRIIIPASILFCSVIDFCVLFIFFIILEIAFFGCSLYWNILIIPILLLWLIVFSFSVNLFFASIIVKYRDFKHIVPFVVQVGMYCSPVGFSSHIFAIKWRLLFAFNPLAGIIDSFRWALLDQSVYFPVIVISIVMTIVLFILSLYYFRAVEDSFADVI